MHRTKGTWRQRSSSGPSSKRKCTSCFLPLLFSHKSPMFLTTHKHTQYTHTHFTHKLCLALLCSECIVRYCRLQAQCRTAEDRFCRQFGMDTQVATLRQTRDQDLREIVRKLGEENNALRADNQYFREQVEILICEQMEILMMQEVARSNSELKQDSLEKYIAKHLVNGRHIADLEAEVKGQESEVKLQRRLSAENEQKNAFIKEVVAELSAINERDILSLHIKDQKLQIKALVSQVHRSEERSCELAATNKQLSKSYQNKLEILQRNHKEIMTDVQEQLEKLRSQVRCCNLVVCETTRFTLCKLCGEDGHLPQLKQ